MHSLPEAKQLFQTCCIEGEVARTKDAREAKIEPTCRCIHAAQFPHLAFSVKIGSFQVTNR